MFALPCCFPPFFWLSTRAPFCQWHSGTVAWVRWVRGGGALAFPLSAWSRVRHCFHLCDPRGGGDTRDPTNKLHSSLSCFTTIWQWLTRSSIQDKQQARSHVVLDTVPPPPTPPTFSHRTGTHTPLFQGILFFLPSRRHHHHPSRSR